MNPFLLHGPQFLGFYLLFAGAVLALLYFARRALEDGNLPALERKDPYLFACLNGGPKEVLRVATVGLVDRKLLQLTGRTAHTVPNAAPDFGKPQVERKILDHFKGGASLSSAWDDKGLLAFAAATYEPRLRSFGLLPNAEMQRIRRLSLAAAIVALLGVGGAKVWVALSIGRTNIAFLIVLMVVATVIAAAIWSPYRTRLGDDYLYSVRSLFAGLPGRVSSLRPGGQTSDLLWLGALFGVASLPSTVSPVAAYAAPKPVTSSCGSSSCGGSGGCGGGGGGCGGCGS